MQKFWRSNQFQALQDEWNEKLRASGFIDAEKEVNGELALKYRTAEEYKWGGIFRHAKDETIRQSRMDYFYILSQKILQEAEFDDESDRLIMEWTSEGKTIREISDELKSKGLRKFNRDTIRYIRRRYEDKWGIKSWTREEMVSRRVRSK